MTANSTAPQSRGIKHVVPVLHCSETAGSSINSDSAIPRGGTISTSEPTGSGSPSLPQVVATAVASTTSEPAAASTTSEVSTQDGQHGAQTAVPLTTVSTTIEPMLDQESPTTGPTGASRSSDPTFAPPGSALGRRISSAKRKLSISVERTFAALKPPASGDAPPTDFPERPPPTPRVFTPRPAAPEKGQDSSLSRLGEEQETASTPRLTLGGAFSLIETPSDLPTLTSGVPTQFPERSDDGTDRPITADEIKQAEELRIKELYHQLSPNGQPLTPKMLSEAFARLRIPSSSMYVRALMKHANKAVENEVNQDEFARIFRKKERELRILFSEIDNDHDGRITAAELEQALIRASMSRGACVN